MVERTDVQAGNIMVTIFISGQMAVSSRLLLLLTNGLTGCFTSIFKNPLPVRLKSGGASAITPGRLSRNTRLQIFQHSNISQRAMVQLGNNTQPFTRKWVSIAEEIIMTANGKCTTMVTDEVPQKT